MNLCLDCLLIIFSIYTCCHTWLMKPISLFGKMGTVSEGFLYSPNYLSESLIKDLEKNAFFQMNNFIKMNLIFLQKCPWIDKYFTFKELLWSLYKRRKKSFHRQWSCNWDISIIPHFWSNPFLTWPFLTQLIFEPTTFWPDRSNLRTSPQ